MGVIILIGRNFLFRFVADERVDFRNLARELGSIFKTRIELRQIGIRDKSKEVEALVIVDVYYVVLVF